MTKKQLAFTAAKIGFTALILTWLLRSHSKMQPAQIWENIRHANPVFVLAGILLCWTPVAIAGWRWHRLLQVFQMEIPVATLICIAQIGQFFLMFLPGPTGDDLTRMLYISRLAKGRVGEACTSVLLDRLIGLSSILLVALFLVPWQWPLLAAEPKTYWMSVCILAAGGCILAGGLLFFLGNKIFLERMVGKGLQLLPASKIRTELLRINACIFTRRELIATVVAAAMITQFILCGVFCLAGRAVGIDAPFTTWIGFVPIVLAGANIVPTVAGLGVREGLMVLLLRVLAHVPADSGRAFAASIVAFSMMVAVSLLGGLVYIVYKPAKETAA